MACAFWPAVSAGLLAGAILEGPVDLQQAVGLDVKVGIPADWVRRRGEATGRV
ncbi:MAG: hypothetical protein M3Q65_08825 [Chloroflexota bacterium]|nr:hypothetical protein [Chloroflexota bacterium]